MAFDENANLGVKLEAEYGEGKSQDLHIDYFYFILGEEIVDKRMEIIFKLKDLKTELLDNLESEWPEFVIGKFAKINELESERDREERLNQQIRIPLLNWLFPQTPPPRSAIIISRVCKYTKYVVPELTTSEIETALSACANLLDQHLDLFYLRIKVRVPQFQDQIKAVHLTKMVSTWFYMESVKPCKTMWKMVKPEQTCPLTFIGYIPKKPFELEREREWRINTEIRLPLKKYLDGELKKNHPLRISENQKVVVVLFSRVCKYTNM